MLFLSQSHLEKRRQLSDDFQSDRIAAEKLYEELLKLDPDDFVGLVGRAKANREAGNLQAAEDYYWRAIRVNPCLSEPYIDLGQILYSDPATRELGMGLGELGILKRAREQGDDSFLQDLDASTPEIQEAIPDEIRALAPEDRVDLIASAMRVNRENEPESVTAKLRCFRFIEELQSGEELTPGAIDAGNELGAGG